MTVRQLGPWIVGAALIALPFVYREPYHLHLVILILIWSFAYTSWSMMGRFGLVSLGHGGFMGVGAYVTALLWNHLGVSPWLGIPVAMFAAAMLAIVVGYPCFRFRIRGHYFVLVTLALSGIVLLVITAMRKYTGGLFCLSQPTAPVPKTIRNITANRMVMIAPIVGPSET